MPITSARTAALYDRVRNVISTIERSIFRHPHETIGEDCEFVRRMGRVGMVVGETIGLARNRFGDFGTAIADIHAIETSEPRQSTGCHARPECGCPSRSRNGRLAEFARGEILELRERMQDAVSVLFANFLNIDLHDCFLSGRGHANAGFSEIHESVVLISHVWQMVRRRSKWDRLPSSPAWVRQTSQCSCSACKLIDFAATRPRSWLQRS